MIGWVLLASDVAMACTVCGAAEDNANTFLASTLGLSLLPLAMIFGGAYALYRAYHDPGLFD